MLRFRSSPHWKQGRCVLIEVRKHPHYIKLFCKLLKQFYEGVLQFSLHENGYNLLCVASRRFVSLIQSDILVKLLFTFWSLDGVIFQCRQKYFNTIIYKGCSSKRLLFHVQTRRNNWVSVVWKLGEICRFFEMPETGLLLTAKTVSFQQLIQILLLSSY